jgi:hypothetical protein
MLTSLGGPKSSPGELDAETVAQVLTTIRRPDIAEAWGWTVPHVERGHGEHLFQVLLTEGGTQLDDDEQYHLVAGTMSTLRESGTKNADEAHALRIAAQYMPKPSIARKIRRLAVILDGASASAIDAVETYEDMLNGSRPPGAGRASFPAWTSKRRTLKSWTAATSTAAPTSRRTTT